MADYDWHTELRVQALDAAVEWRASVQTNQPFGHPQAHDVITVAELFYRWLVSGRRRDFLDLTAGNLRPINPPADAGTL